MSQLQPFKPFLRCRVSSWRGITIKGKHYASGEEIPKGLVDNRTLEVLHRQRAIEQFRPEPIQPIISEARRAQLGRTKSQR